MADIDDRMSDFYHILINPANGVFQRILGLRRLTDEGRNFQPFMTEIWPVLTALILDSSNAMEPARNATDATSPLSTLALELTSNGIRFNAKWLDAYQLKPLLDVVILLATHTTKSSDLEAALTIFDLCLTYTHIPWDSVQGVMHIVTRCYHLRSRMNRHKRVAAHAWAVMKHLLATDYLAQPCIDTLLNTIGYGEENKDWFGSIAGSLQLMEDKLLTRLAKDWEVSISEFIKCLTLRAASTAPVLLEQVIGLTSRILRSGRILRDITLDRTWPDCGKLVQQLFTNKTVLKSSALQGTPMLLVSHLMESEDVENNMQAFEIADVCLSIAEYVDDDNTITKLLDFCKANELLHHYAAGYHARFHTVASNLLQDLSRSSSVRHQTAALLSESPVLAEDPKEWQLLLEFFTGFDKEIDIVVLEQLTETATILLRHSQSITTLEAILDSFGTRISTNGWFGAYAAIFVTKLTIKLFLQYFDDTLLVGDTADVTRKVCVVFERLQATAMSDPGRPPVPPDASVAALKLLFRVRSDVEGKIYILGLAEGEDLAANLSRTVVAPKQPPRDPKSSRPSTSTATSRDGDRSEASMSGHVNALPGVPPEGVSRTLVSSKNYGGGVVNDHAAIQVIDMNAWLRKVIDIIDTGANWEVYSYTIIHLGAQLSNHSLLADAVTSIRKLRSLLCSQLTDFSFSTKPPLASSLKKADIAVCLYQSLTMTIGYHHHFTRMEKEEIVGTFLIGIGSTERTSAACVHALTICCYELPNAVISHLANLLQKMAQAITQSHVAVHILEFLASLSRMADLYRNFRHDDLKKIFGICFQYLKYFRDERDTTNTRPASRATSESGGSGASLSDTPQYPYALAYHVITFWYINLKPSDGDIETDGVTMRQWIGNNLAMTDDAGQQTFEDAAIVVLDLMAREDALNGESDDVEDYIAFTDSEKHTWLLGLLILTTEIDLTTGSMLVTYRQASGTTREMLALSASQCHVVSGTNDDDLWLLPRDVVRKARRLLQDRGCQKVGLETLYPTISYLNVDDAVRRAIDAFDRVPALDSHKVGVIYVGEEQYNETDILLNVMGSPDYNRFVHGLGTLVALRNAKFATHGLDRFDNLDGEHTILWRNEVTELVFHITTYMPTNLETDPLGTQKKKHVGNNFINIVFNNSGGAFDFSTLPSAFNYVYIVITPSARTTFLQTRLPKPATAGQSVQEPFYKVQVLSQAGFPDISSAAEAKIISGTSLPEYVRNLALSACVFAQVWANDRKEYPSSWRSRLQQLRTIRDRYGPRA